MSDAPSGNDARNDVPLKALGHRSRRIMLLDTSMKVLYPSILMLAFYFLFAGHNRPGGGFVGGLVLGGALALRYVSGGAEAVRTTFRLPPHLFLGIGLSMSALTAFIPIVLGGSILEHGDATFHLPIFGKVKVTSALTFDFGVDLVVIGLALMAFVAFGEDTPNAPGAADDGSDAPTPRPALRQTGRRTVLPAVPPTVRQGPQP